MLSRRTFLTSASTAALVATGGLGTSRKAYGQSAPDPNIYGTTNNAHSTVIGNAFYVGNIATDWFNIHTSLTAAGNEWRASGRDASVMAAVSNVSPSMLTSANINQQSVLQAIQASQPNIKLEDVQTALSVLDNHQTLVPQVLSQLQNSGMSNYIVSASKNAYSLWSLIVQSQNAGSSSVARRATPHLLWPDLLVPVDGGGKGYNCAADGAFILAASIAFATITVMTLGSAPILVGAAWGGIALWGGLGTTAWGAGHVIAGCGF